MYRASAGSGKTYTLTYNYLRLVLKYPDYFKSVLAVTFTNKATQEMKSRIVETLKELSSHGHGMATQLKEDLGLSDAQLKERASQVLLSILHNYSFFAVTTIDAFFQKVVRSFAREIGIHTGFKIELDQNKVLKEVVDQMIQKISEDAQLLKWLTDFAISEINEGKSWDTSKSILTLSKELFKEEVVDKREQVFEKLEETTFMDGLIKNVRQRIVEFESTYRGIGQSAVQMIEGYGLTEGSFTYGSSGVGGYMYKVSQGDIKEPGVRVSKALEEDAWVAKTSKEKDQVMSLVHAGLRDLLTEMVAYYESHVEIYNSLTQVSRQLYAFGLLSRISQEIVQYKDENELLLISDFQLFLNEIISDSDSPYVYEKIGTRYKHYLIDEFQDTSSMQWGNFKPLIQDSLSSGNFNMVVGDVKQSIYRWRGGDWDILLNKVKQGIDASVIDELNLKTNRRSKENIVSFNNDFFEQAPYMIESALQGGSEILRVQEAYDQSSQELFDTSGEGLIQLDFYEKSEVEKDYPMQILIQNIQTLQRANYALSDIAILVRGNREGREVAQALMNHQMEYPDDGFSYDVLSNESLYIKNNKAVHLMLQLLNYILFPHEKLYKKQVEYALKFWFEDEELPTVMEQIRSKLTKWQSFRLSELIQVIVRQFDLLDSEEDLPYVMAFSDAVDDFLEYESDTIVDFINWWSDHDKRSIQVSENQDAMAIMTIHKSKGLQFKAVLIPFCNWLFDHRAGLMSQFLWSERANDPAVLGLPLVPVKYTATLSNTIFSKDYFAEKHDIHLDNLNLLYVAMTRAEEALFITSAIDKNAKSIKTSGQLVYEYALKQGLIEEDKQQAVVGQLPAFSSYDAKTVSSYSIHPRKLATELGNNIILRYQSRILEEAQIDSINYGDIVHWIFSKITKRSDFSSAIEMAVLKFGLRTTEIDEIKTRLRQIWDLPQVPQWFTDGWEVKNEASILLSDGKMKRPDRVVIKGDRALVIDYKTGAKSAGHIRQVEEYKSILAKMGYKTVEGYLIYFTELEVMKV
ncbi:UvrD-helicase domain-containing protein [Reichenbachiella agarivorans]|uniref:DNA 3'-5' helicase n=1 Tax=Reichenbachiella agarivorans TaxID=2979464 RepID=A0ABY6CUJ6_9BACT|nr:UvrD-helicase domain-containing protein [Reichenbachiella agarivorans]